MYRTEESIIRKEKEYFERRTVIEGMLLVIVLAFALLLNSVRVFALGALAILCPMYLMDLDRFVTLRIKFLKLHQD